MGGIIESRPCGASEHHPSLLHFHRNKQGIQILDPARNGELRYYVETYQEVDYSGVILRLVNGRSCAAVGKARIRDSEKNLTLAIDDFAASPATRRQEIVKCVNNPRVFGHEGYQFTVSGIIDLEDNGHDPAHQNFVWKQTHNGMIGTSRQKSKGLKLTNESTKGPVAVYIYVRDTDNAMGKLEWKTQCSGDEEEVRALLVLMAVLERFQRSKNQARRLLYLE